MDHEAVSRGQIFNIGHPENEITIIELAYKMAEIFANCKLKLVLPTSYLKALCECNSVISFYFSYSHGPVYCVLSYL